MIPLIYPSSPWRTLEMPLINCEVNLIFSWSANCPLVTDIVTNNVANIYNIRYKNLCFSHNFITWKIRMCISIWLSIWNNNVGIKTIYSLFSWSDFPGSKYVCFITWKYWAANKLQVTFSSNHRNERLQCYDRWKTFFFD